MPTLSEIKNSPEYVNANAATKEAIFAKYSANDQNYVNANEETKLAIRKKFGIVSEETQSIKETPEEPSRVAEALRKGFSEGVGNIAGAMEFLGSGIGGGRSQYGFTSGKENVTKPMMEALGSTGVKPRTQTEQIGMGAVEALTDPSTYLLPAGAGVKLFSGFGKPLYKAAEGLLTGGGSEAGGIAGEGAGRALGGEKGAQIGRVVGSLTGGAGTGTLAGQTPRTIAMATPAVGKIKSLIAKARGLEPLEEAEKAAQKHIDNIFIAAATADPHFADVFEKAMIAQKQTGVELPLSAMMKDNPVINAYIGHLASKDQSFRKEYFEQFEKAKKGLGVKAEKLFGTPVDADKILAKSVSEKGEDFAAIGKKVEKRAGTLTGEARRFSEEITEINPAEFGSRIVKVTDAAESAARASTRPKYKEAFDIAKTKNLDLPETAVEDIYDTVVSGKNSDIFATFPSIYGKVKSTFKPKESPTSMVTEYGIIPIEAKTTFSKATIEDMDSLKKEINLQLRKAKTDSHIRVLQDLKSKLDIHIDSLDSEFVSAYRNADKTYLMRVGLPFNEETIKSIERAKFDENIIPLLTKNKSTASQFIAVTGDNGKKLVEDALISDLSKHAIRDGILDTNRAKAWMASHREQLTLLPDTKKNIEKLSGDVGLLLERKKILESSFDDATKARILKTEGTNAQELVNKMYSSGNFTTRFIKQYGNDKEAMNAVRSFMLDDIIKSGKPIDVLNDRSRKNVYDSMFGSSYSGMVNNLALISDRITKDPSAVSANLKDIDADMLTKMIGMPPERLTSLFFTNPVVSKPVAIMTVVNRFFNKKAGEIVERDMKKLLLDREAGTRILYAMKPGADGKISLERLNSLASWAKKRGYDFAQMLKEDAQAGALRSYRGMNEEEIQQYEEQK